MVNGQAWNAYRKNESEAKIHPVKLINMLYERVIIHLDSAEEGVLSGDNMMRGENLSKAIAIIAELNASIKEKDESEAAQFLRGVYAAILVELPKVSVSNDVASLQLAKKYLVKLREIWQETAMKEAGFGEPSSAVVNDAHPQVAKDKVAQSEKSSGYGGGAKATAIGARSLSFAI